MRSWSKERLLFVSKFERGELRLHGDLIIKLAAALGVSTDELLGFAGKEPTVRPAVKDRRLWRRIMAIDRLSKRDRAALVRTIDAFLSKLKLSRNRDSDTSPSSQPS